MNIVVLSVDVYDRVTTALAPFGWFSDESSAALGHGSGNAITDEVARDLGTNVFEPKSAVDPPPEGSMKCVVRIQPESARGSLWVRGMGTHVDIDPAILYFSTPVMLLSTPNKDGGTNLMPMRCPEPVEGSSVFWLGRTAVLGMGASSQTARNVRERPEIVLDLPGVDLVTQVDRLALTTCNAAMSAAKFCGLGEGVHPSRLASIDEELCR